MTATEVIKSLQEAEAKFWDKLRKFSIQSTSCCGGKSGGAKWDSSSNQWVCKDCGSSQSNDPTYLYNPTGLRSNTPTVEWPKTKCECGSSSVGSDRHSGYCPLYRSP